MNFSRWPATLSWMSAVPEDPVRPFLKLLFLACLALCGAAGSQAPLETAYYSLPGAVATVNGDAVSISYGPYRETYVAGLGWLSNLAADPPVLRGDDVLVNASVLDALGVTEPRLAGIRYSGGAEVRIVLDFVNISPAALAGLRSGGTREAGAPLELQLPRLLLPAGTPEDVSGLELELAPAAAGVRLRLTGPAFEYAAFPLDDPPRLVIDVTPQRDLSQLVESEREVAPGVTYRRYRVFADSGPSVVHLVSIAPGSGEFRVVGQSRVAMSVTQLASGALVALNAGYFDTSDYAAIGLLKIDHGLLSLPSRGRAGVAFGVPGGPLIDRLDADVLVTTSRGVLRVGTSNGDGVSVTTAAGALAGAPSQGVLIIQDGTVVENKIGPRLVPKGGMALAYPATNRDLALLDTGDRVSIDTSLRPGGFQVAAYAVEAGPLLVRDGLAAYEPSSEGFASGQRILDGLTQQAAIGVMPDGTTLLVVAETMRAQDLVRLFLDLGADRAMRFDSGSSTTLVVAGQVVNRKTERKVVSAVVFIPALAER